MNTLRARLANQSECVLRIEALGHTRPDARIAPSGLTGLPLQSSSDLKPGCVQYQYSYLFRNNHSCCLCALPVATRSIDRGHRDAAPPGLVCDVPSAEPDSPSAGAGPETDPLDTLSFVKH